MFIKTL